MHTQTPLLRRRELRLRRGSACPRWPTQPRWCRGPSPPRPERWLLRRGSHTGDHAARRENTPARGPGPSLPGRSRPPSQALVCVPSACSVRRTAAPRRVFRRKAATRSPGFCPLRFARRVVPSHLVRSGPWGSPALALGTARGAGGRRAGPRAAAARLDLDRSLAAGPSPARLSQQSGIGGGAPRGDLGQGGPRAGRSSRRAGRWAAERRQSLPSLARMPRKGSEGTGPGLARETARGTACRGQGTGPGAARLLRQRRAGGVSIGSSVAVTAGWPAAEAERQGRRRGPELRSREVTGPGFRPRPARRRRPCS